jgi:predicted Ser/Thr protein kinase
MSPLQPLLPNDPLSIGDYKIAGRLGPGGMGIVYRGSDENGRKVAIKVIHEHLAVDQRFRERFRREADHALRVREEFIAPVLEVGSHGGLPFMVTEYIPGPTLAEYVQEHGPMPPFEVKRFGLEVAQALSAIHAAGLIHRDLKPNNIILGATGPRVIDFGIARPLEDSGGLTSVGTRLGTPEYMAPEQFQPAGKVTTATDVFAWGGLMVFASTGRPPFGSRDEGGVDELASRIKRHWLNLNGLDPSLRGVIRDAMHKEEDRRPSAEELRRRLVPEVHPAPTRPAATTSAQPQGSSTAFAAPVGQPSLKVKTTVRPTDPGDVGPPAGPSEPSPWARLRLLGLAALKVLLVIGAIMVCWWLVVGIAAHVGLYLLLPAVVALDIGGLVLAYPLVQRVADEDRGWGFGVGAGLLVVAVAIPISTYHGLHDRYWVGFDRGQLAVLQGAGPGGFGVLHVHNTTRVERFDTQRDGLLPLIAGALDKGIQVGGWSSGRELAQCLPRVFTPAPDAPTEPGGEPAMCADGLAETPPPLPVAEGKPIPDASAEAPALLATTDKVLLAWRSGSDERLRLSSTTDGLNLAPAKALPYESVGSPALATDGSAVFMAWQDPNDQLALAWSSDGINFDHLTRLGLTSATAPALAYGNGQLVIAWADKGFPYNLHVMATTNPPDFSQSRDVTLDQTSEQAPSLTFADGTWYLSWVGTDNQVNLLASPDPLSYPSSGKAELGVSSASNPAIVKQGIWLLAFTDPDDGTIGLLGSKHDSPNFVNQLTLDVQSAGTSMASFGGRLLLAWADEAQQAIHVVALT